MVLDTDMDTTESVMLSQRLMLIPTFCMVDTTDTVLDTMDMVLDMDMDTMDTLDTPDTMDTPMPLTAITDKLFPLVLWTANHPCFLYQCPHFQCLTSFWVTDSRKHENKDT